MQASRVAASLLQSAGMPDLISESWADYIALVARLANDVSARESLRVRLRRGTLVAPATFARNLLAAFETAYSRYQQHLPPASFDIVEHDERWVQPPPH
jgi:protein O-GlcNAc transferase